MSGDWNPQFTKIPGQEPQSWTANFLNMTSKHLGDQVRAKDKEKDTLMQSMSNNNRLHPAAEGDAGSFQYGGQWLKVGPKPETGTDLYNSQRAKYFGESQAQQAYESVYAKAFDITDGDVAASSEAASRAYDDSLARFKTVAPTDTGPKKESVEDIKARYATERDTYLKDKEVKKNQKAVEMFTQKNNESIGKLEALANKSLELAGKPPLAKQPLASVPKVQQPSSWQPQDLELFSKYSMDKGTNQAAFDSKMADIVKESISSGKYTREQLIKQLKSRGFKDPEQFVNAALRGQ